MSAVPMAVVGDQLLAVVGDQLVVPACEIGEVVAIETMTVGDQCGQFYRIRFPKGARTWVPLGRLIEKGIRKVMSRENALEALEVVAAQEAPEKRANWNRRKRRYMEMLLGNQPKVLAELLGELGAVRRHKGSLSFGEMKLFEQVHSLLVAELALALGLDAAAAESRLQTALTG